MKPVHQQFRHDPENAIWGDCHRAAIATVMGLPIDSVPHFGDGGVDADEFWRRERDFLAAYNLRHVCLPFSGDVESVLKAVAVHAGDDAVYLLGGMSPRDASHTVVCRGNKIVHDPHPDGGGLVGPSSSGYLWVSLFVIDDLSRHALVFSGHASTEAA